MIRVVQVEAQPRRRLRVEFSDGSTGVVNMGPEILQFAPYAPLRFDVAFSTATVVDGAVSWPAYGLDIATECLYALAHQLPPPATLEAHEANVRVVQARASSGDLGDPGDAA